MWKRILVIGDVCGDLLLPYQEAKAQLKEVRHGKVKPVNALFRCGGTAGNTAIVLGKLQEKPLLITDACCDSVGQYLLKELTRNGVDCSYSVCGKHASQLCVAVLDGREERIIFPWILPGGSFPSFSSDSFQEGLYQETFHILCSGMILNNDIKSMEAIVDFLCRMKQNGSCFYFDLNTRFETYGLSTARKEYYQKMISLSDVLLGSGVEEFAPLTGKENLRDSVRSLMSEKKIIVARNGKESVLFAENGQIYEVKVKAQKCLNPIGAGDSFNAAFLYGKRRGATTEKAIRFANEIAGYVLSHAGHLEIPDDYQSRYQCIQEETDTLACL